MDRPVGVDPHAPTFTGARTPGDGVWTQTAAVRSSIDPRADTIPTDPAASVTPPPVGEGPDPLLGHMLGHFRVDVLIGRGGMGSVYRAWDTSLLRPVAIKVLLVDSVTARTRFLREARSQAQLRHPNVVPIHYVGESEGIVFLVMDLVEGDSLTDVIRREGRIATERALDIVDAVASALAAGHVAGLIHRDVKPSNILLERSGRALLADFGLAKDLATAEAPAPAEPDGPPTSFRSTALTRYGSIVGTPAYLAPEQASGGPVDHRADMYALGASLFEALTGTPPFDAPTPTAIVEQQRSETVRSPRALVADLHPSVERLVLRLLEKRPEDRFATYDDLRAAIVRARTPALIPAALVPRLVAFGIDYALFGIIGALLFATILMTGLNVRALAWAVAVLGAAVVEWHFDGVSLGKRLMRLRTADRFGLAPSFGSVVARTFLKAAGPALAWVESTMLPREAETAAIVITMVLWVAGLALALGKRGLSLHDRITRTLVVFRDSDPLPKPERRDG
jgi:uncharacterized RDD family membrane protein YckC